MSITPLTAKKPHLRVRKIRFAECKKISVPDCGKSAGNKTEINNTDRSNTNLSIDYDEVENEIKFQIEYDVLAERDYGGVLDEIVRLMTDTYCYASDTV